MRDHGIMYVHQVFDSLSHQIDRESFYREMNGPDFDHIRPAANEAIKLIEAMEKKLEKYLASDVRTCLIHGK